MLTPAPVAAPVAVVGMHRSGTSCLAGCLEDLGLSLGAVNTAAPHNKKGNRENPRFWPVHDAVLARVGAAWDSPPAEPVAWTRDEIAALRAVLDDYADLPRPWGFKDPRATVLLDGWFEVLPELRLVGSIRHPLAVAGSLAARNDFDLDRSLAVWAGYNRALLRWAATPAMAAVIDYDAPDYEARVRAAAAGLGLDAAAPMPFREADLTHQTAGGAVPASVEGLWVELQDAASKPFPWRGKGWDGVEALSAVIPPDTRYQDGVSKPLSPTLPPPDRPIASSDCSSTPALPPSRGKGEER